MIAVFGIANTSALSVIERTREIGLLRAVGASQQQVRRIVGLEAVATAALGVTLGVAMGSCSAHSFNGYSPTNKAGVSGRLCYRGDGRNRYDW